MKTLRQKPVVLQHFQLIIVLNNFIEVKTDLKYNSISIIDVTGKTVLQIDSEAKIDVSHLTTGIYFIKVMGKENTVIKKFVKR